MLGTRLFSYAFSSSMWEATDFSDRNPIASNATSIFYSGMPSCRKVGFVDCFGFGLFGHLDLESHFFQGWKFLATIGLVQGPQFLEVLVLEEIARFW